VSSLGENKSEALLQKEKGSSYRSKAPAELPSLSSLAQITVYLLIISAEIFCIRTNDVVDSRKLFQ